ncbi:4-carboxymuconolactone decarboxylase [Penicillium nucicola]|uniref:4-carboxymuconolactone decarboxylase n=1 Tax=Penicillium nucicola TaxID=1850975 RepID=UPI00254585A8|nr:4-carboxymuconolactone decarboxylase [Penicillium nucicola]KAJ5762533.1 4-carboxymuconolactone decarboxylase [Penicillium nucicola]
MPDSRDPLTEDDLFRAGLQVRREVLGDDYVNKAIQEPNGFTQPLQEVVTKAAWGMVWTRPGLSRATRSMLNIALLSALNRSDELALHLRGAIRNGVTKAEIQEVILHTSMYAGMPAAVSSFKLADRVLTEMENEPKRDSKL